jgi:MYXO-CTERM domain-containing protein
MSLSVDRRVVRWALCLSVLASSALAADEASAYTRFRRFSPHPEAGGTCSVSYTGITDSVAYQGGPVISKIVVVPVFWTGSVDPAVTAWAEGYLGTLVNSPYLDLLGEYTTTATGGTQTIVRGTAGPAKTITPTTATGTTVDDTQIGPEITAQITAGSLPAPVLDASGNPDTLFEIFFPPGTTITQGGGSSCNAFCGYHGSFGSGASAFSYAVIPDMGSGSGCDMGCSDSCTTGNVPVMTGTVSHELAESVTDPNVNSAAWVNPNQQSNNSEIGDICASNAASMQDTGPVPGTNILAQYEWSQQNKECLLSPLNEADAGPPPPIDSGAPPMDSGTAAADSGSAEDSGATDSGGLNEDSGSLATPDSGSSTDSGTKSDGGFVKNGDAGPGTAPVQGSNGGGCHCGVASRDASAAGGWLLVFGLLALRVRRRQSAAR